MKTVILLDGWIFRGEVQSEGASVRINDAECVSSGNQAGAYVLPAGKVVIARDSSVVAIIE